MSGAMFRTQLRVAAAIVVASLSVGTTLAANVGNPAGAPPKPSSYAPHHSTGHVYGAPIDPPAVRYGRSRHHVAQVAKKAPQRATLGTLNMTPHVTAQ